MNATLAQPTERAAAAPPQVTVSWRWRAFLLAVLLAALVVLVAVVAFHLLGGPTATDDGRVPSPSPQAPAQPVRAAAG